MYIPRLIQFNAEYIRQVVAGDCFAPGITGACQRVDGAGGGHQVQMIHLPEFEEKFRLGIEPCAYAIEHSGEVLA